MLPRTSSAPRALRTQPCFESVRPHHRSALSCLASRHYVAALLHRPCACTNSCRVLVRCPGATSIDAAAASSSHSHHPQQQLHLPPCQPHDVIKAATVDGVELYLEVLPLAHQPAAALSQSPTTSNITQQPPTQVQLAHQGVIYTVDNSSNSPYLQLQPQGWHLSQRHPLVQALPGWGKALELQQSKQQLPQQPLQLQSVEVVYASQQLQRAVQQNPALWRDGTGPLDPPLQGLPYQTLCAGEIQCLLNRSRGVVMVQLSIGWDVSAPQPVNNLLVVDALQRVLADRQISIFMSKASGDLGLTAILSARAEPFRSWAAHLASFGAQAALVADSPFYKLLIGRILGYKEENIRFHIQATSGRQQPTPEVIAAVDKDLAKISRKKPELPWKADPVAHSGRGRSPKERQKQPRSAARR